MISAKIIEDSIYDGVRLTTMQLQMPRFLLAQFNTHRAFSRNASSSRAIPTAKVIEDVMNNPVIPTRWGSNQKGMQAGDDIQHLDAALTAWLSARDDAVKHAQVLLDLGLHKQLANRILEPFMWAHAIVTATDWDNFFKLRINEASQPEMQELAKHMKEAMDASEPVKREYHLPYITETEKNEYDWVCESAKRAYEDLRDISAARCARVSYLNHDGTALYATKDRELAYKLLDAGHWSPFEHQAVADGDSGRTYGNFYGWKQYRQDID